jgi:hypothetical protein
MFKHFERHRLVLALLGFAIFQALVIGALLLSPALESRAAYLEPPQAQALSEPRIIERLELDSWRNEAVLGGSWASAHLVSALLDNYERSHDSDDLFEAMQWMERGWPSGLYQNSGIATRVFERHCGHKVLRWHWLCDQGE